MDKGLSTRYYDEYKSLQTCDKMRETSIREAVLPLLKYLITYIMLRILTLIFKIKHNSVIATSQMVER